MFKEISKENEISDLRDTEGRFESTEDTGTAEIPRRHNPLTFSVCGTPQYMSPEILAE